MQLQRNPCPHFFCPFAIGRRRGFDWWSPPASRALPIPGTPEWLIQRSIGPIILLLSYRYRFIYFHASFGIINAGMEAYRRLEVASVVNTNKAISRQATCCNVAEMIEITARLKLTVVRHLTVTIEVSEILQSMLRHRSSKDHVKKIAEEFDD